MCCKGLSVPPHVQRRNSAITRVVAAHPATRYNGGMNWLHWLGENWFTGLQTVAIVSGLVFTCITLRRDSHSRRISSLFQITANHREVWEKLLTQPKLHRVLSLKPDIDREPVTVDETIFVEFLILHLNSAHQAMRNGVMDAPEGLSTDIRTLFSLPIPRAVWEDKRRFQDGEFIAFVERNLNRNDLNRA